MTHANTLIYQSYKTPIGEMLIGVTDEGCALLEFADEHRLEQAFKKTAARYRCDFIEGDHDLFNTIKSQLDEYFAGSRQTFDFALHIEGTDFEKKVWQQLLNIPFGITASYGEIAKLMNNSGASRAVGRANGANHMAIIIPCHRVIDSKGGLHGYGGGLSRKKWLLDHESSQPQQLTI